MVNAAESPPAETPTESFQGMGFFRKYQKPILFTAVLFALVTFSIPVALTGFFQPRDEYEGPSMTLPGGREVRVTLEDWNVAGGLMASLRDLTTVLPDVSGGETEDLRERLAALRRLAIEAGIEGSMTEADRAIGQALKHFPEIESPTQLARRIMGYPSLDAYRAMVREALRVGTFLRLQSAGADTSDAALAEYLAEEGEMLTLRVASLDKTVLEESLKEQGIEDDALRTWIDELGDDDKRPYLDFNLASLVAVGLDFDAFDPAEFSAELGDKAETMTDAELQSQYALRRETYFRKPEPETPENGEPETPGGEEPEAGGSETGQTQEQEAAPAEAPAAEGEEQSGATEEGGESTEEQNPEPVEDPYYEFSEVSERLKKMLLAEAALDALRTGALQDLEAAHMRPAIAVRNQAVRAAGEAREALAAARAELAEDPDNDDLEKKVEDAEAAVETAEQAEQDAQDALSTHRATFDFAGEMTRLLAGRKGVLTFRQDTPSTGTDYQDLGELGTWEAAAGSFAATLDSGEISAVVQRTDKACFYFQAPEVKKNPLKPFEDIAEEARTHYFASRADEIAEADREKLETALLDLAKAKLGERVAEIEQEHRDKADTEFSDWKTDLESRLATATASRAQLENRPNSQSYRSWNDEVVKLEGELATADEKRAGIDEQASEDAEAEIAEEARKLYKDVLMEAVTDTSFVVRDLPAYSARLSSKPRFEHRYAEDVQYLFRELDVTDLEVDEITDILEDTTGRALHVALCTERAPMTVADLTRRELMEAREQFVQRRLALAMAQSFSEDALGARYDWQRSTRGPDDETPGLEPDPSGQEEESGN